MGQENADPLKWFTDRPLATFLLAGVLSGSGLNGLWTAASNPRPDPWTGSDAKAAEQRSILRDKDEARAREAKDAHLSYQIQTLESALKQLKDTVMKHNQEAELWKDRIRTCEHGCNR